MQVIGGNEDDVKIVRGLNSITVDASSIAFAGTVSAETFAPTTVDATIVLADNAGNTVQTLTDGATITWDADLGSIAVITLGGDRAISNPTNIKTGGLYTIIIKQDAVGTRLLTWGTNFKFAGGTAPTLTTTASKVDVVTFRAESTTILRHVSTVLNQA
jgi:hypothetical protein